MVRIIKYFLAIGSILGFSFAFGQEKVLRLDPGKTYEMYFVNVQFRPAEDFQIDTIGRNKLFISWDKAGSFVIDDSATIHTLKTEWTGEHVYEGYGCWYDYFVYLVEDGVVIDEMRMNEKCKQVITKHGIYNYSDSPLGSINRDKKFVVADITLREPKLGRDLVNDAKKRREVFLPNIDEADWYKFDGEMIVMTKDGSIEERQKEVQDRIRSDFPGEKVDVHFLVAWPDKILFYVYCSGNVGPKFMSFEILSGYKRYSPVTIRLFSKTQDPINELVEKYGKQQKPAEEFSVIK